MSKTESESGKSSKKQGGVAKESAVRKEEKGSKSKSESRVNGKDEAAKASKSNDVAKESKSNDVAKESKSNEVAKESKSNEVAKESKSNEVAKESKSNEVAKESKSSKSNEVAKEIKEKKGSDEVAQESIVETLSKSERSKATVKLIYFNGKGRAELARLILAAANVDFEDERIDSATWTQLKPHTPMGQLPLLEFDGERLCQSLSIARFLARSFDLYGQTALDTAKIDMIVDYVQDFNTKWMSVFRASSSPSEQSYLISDIMNNFLPRFLSNLEAILASRHSEFFSGNKLSLADLAVFDALYSLTDESDPFYSELPLDTAFRLSILDEYPRLIHLVARVLEHQGVNQWIQNRPQGLF